jgi:hypothetical protein
MEYQTGNPAKINHIPTRHNGQLNISKLQQLKIGS